MAEEPHASASQQRVSVLALLSPTPDSSSPQAEPQRRTAPTEIASDPIVSSDAEDNTPVHIRADADINNRARPFQTVAETKNQPHSSPRRFDISEESPLKTASQSMAPSSPADAAQRNLPAVVQCAIESASAAEPSSSTGSNNGNAKSTRSSMLPPQPAPLGPHLQMPRDATNLVLTANQSTEQRAGASKGANEDDVPLSASLQSQPKAGAKQYSALASDIKSTAFSAQRRIANPRGGQGEVWESSASDINAGDDTDTKKNAAADRSDPELNASSSKTGDVAEEQNGVPQAQLRSRRLTRNSARSAGPPGPIAPQPKGGEVLSDARPSRRQARAKPADEHVDVSPVIKRRRSKRISSVAQHAGSKPAKRSVDQANADESAGSEETEKPVRRKGGSLQKKPGRLKQNASKRGRKQFTVNKVEPHVISSGEDDVAEVVASEVEEDGEEDEESSSKVRRRHTRAKATTTLRTRKTITKPRRKSVALPTISLQARLRNRRPLIEKGEATVGRRASTKRKSPVEAVRRSKRARTTRKSVNLKEEEEDTSDVSNDDDDADYRASLAEGDVEEEILEDGVAGDDEDGDEDGDEDDDREMEQSEDSDLQESEESSDQDSEEFDEPIRKKRGKPQPKQANMRRKRTSPTDAFKGTDNELSAREQRERLDFLVNQSADIARELHQALADAAKAAPVRNVSKGAGQGEVSPDGAGADAQETKAESEQPTSTRREEEKFAEPIGEGCLLQPHQYDGVNWLFTLDAQGLNAILADEMGLGKTIQAVAFLASLVLNGSRGPHLIIAPKNVCNHWVEEIERWYPGQFNVVSHLGGAEERLENLSDVLADDNFDFIVTSFEISMRDLFLPRRVDGLSSHSSKAQRAFRKVKFEYLVVDEAHRMKNDSSKMNIGIRQFGNAQRRLLLTGTPLSNNLRELWSLMNILNPRIFSSKATFESWFSAPFDHVKGKRKAVMTHAEQSVIVDRLHTVIRPFFRRRERKDVCPTYTSADEVLIHCPLSLLQRALMYHFQRRASERHVGVSNILMAMRSASNHPYTATDAFDDGSADQANPRLVANSGKFSFLHYALPRLIASGHKILIFSQFRNVLDYLEDLMDLLQIKYGRLDGLTTSEDRLVGISEFNSQGQQIPIYLLTTRAGGVGLNLQSADTVILFDSDWNPSADLQAVSRIQRIGQKRTVHIMRLVSDNSIDDHIVSIASHKRRTQTVAVNAGQFHTSSGAAVDYRLRQKELEELLAKLEAVDYLKTSEEVEKDQKVRNSSPESLSPAVAKAPETSERLSTWYAKLLRPGETCLKEVDVEHIWVDSSPDSGSGNIPEWLAKDSDLVAAAKALNSKSAMAAIQTYKLTLQSRARSGAFSKKDRAKRACRNVVIDLSDLDSGDEESDRSNKKSSESDPSVTMEENAQDSDEDDLDNAVLEELLDHKKKGSASKTSNWLQNRFRDAPKDSSIGQPAAVPKPIAPSLNMDAASTIPQVVASNVAVRPSSLGDVSAIETTAIGTPHLSTNALRGAAPQSQLKKTNPSVPGTEVVSDRGNSFQPASEAPRMLPPGFLQMSQAAVGALGPNSTFEVLNVLASRQAGQTAAAPVDSGGATATAAQHSGVQPVALTGAAYVPKRSLQKPRKAPAMAMSVPTASFTGGASPSHSAVRPTTGAAHLIPRAPTQVNARPNSSDPPFPGSQPTPVSGKLAGLPTSPSAAQSIAVPATLSNHPTPAPVASQTGAGYGLQPGIAVPANPRTLTSNLVPSATHIKAPLLPSSSFRQPANTDDLACSSNLTNSNETAIKSCEMLPPRIRSPDQEQVVTQRPLPTTGTCSISQQQSQLGRHVVPLLPRPAADNVSQPGTSQARPIAPATRQVSSRISAQPVIQPPGSGPGLGQPGAVPNVLAQPPVSQKTAALLKQSQRSQQAATRNFVHAMTQLEHAKNACAAGVVAPVTSQVLSSTQGSNPQLPTARPQPSGNVVGGGVAHRVGVSAPGFVSGNAAVASPLIPQFQSRRPANPPRASSQRSTSVAPPDPAAGVTGATPPRLPRNAATQGPSTPIKMFAVAPPTPNGQAVPTKGVNRAVKSPVWSTAQNQSRIVVSPGPTGNQNTVPVPTAVLGSQTTQVRNPGQVVRTKQGVQPVASIIVAKHQPAITKPAAQTPTTVAPPEIVMPPKRPAGKPLTTTKSNQAISSRPIGRPSAAPSPWGSTSASTPVPVARKSLGGKVAPVRQNPALVSATYFVPSARATAPTPTVTAPVAAVGGIAQRWAPVTQPLIPAITPPPGLPRWPLGLDDLQTNATPATATRASTVRVVPGTPAASTKGMTAAAARMTTATVAKAAAGAPVRSPAVPSTSKPAGGKAAETALAATAATHIPVGSVNVASAKAKAAAKTKGIGNVRGSKGARWNSSNDAIMMVPSASISVAPRGAAATRGVPVARQVRKSFPPTTSPAAPTVRTAVQTPAAAFAAPGAGRKTGLTTSAAGTAPTYAPLAVPPPAQVSTKQAPVQSSPAQVKTTQAQAPVSGKAVGVVQRPASAAVIGAMSEASKSGPTIAQPSANGEGTGVAGVHDAGTVVGAGAVSESNESETTSTASRMNGLRAGVFQIPVGNRGRARVHVAGSGLPSPGGGDAGTARRRSFSAIAPPIARKKAQPTCASNAPGCLPNAGAGPGVASAAVAVLPAVGGERRAAAAKRDGSGKTGGAATAETTAISGVVKSNFPALVRRLQRITGVSDLSVLVDALLTSNGDVDEAVRVVRGE